MTNQTAKPKRSAVATPEQKKELEGLRLEFLRLGEDDKNGAVWRAERALKNRETWAVKLGAIGHSKSDINGSTQTFEVIVNLIASEEQIRDELQQKVMAHLAFPRWMEAFDSPESVQPDKEKRVEEFIREATGSLEIYKERLSGKDLKVITLERYPNEEYSVAYQKTWNRLRDAENYIIAAKNNEFPPKKRKTTRPKIKIKN